MGPWHCPGPFLCSGCCTGREGECMEQTVLTAISAVGFPIVVTFYLLTRFQNLMDKFTEQIGRLVEELQKR